MALSDPRLRHLIRPSISRCCRSAQSPKGLSRHPCLEVLGTFPLRLFFAFFCVLCGPKALRFSRGPEIPAPPALRRKAQSGTISVLIESTDAMLRVTRLTDYAVLVLSVMASEPGHVLSASELAERTQDRKSTRLNSSN